MSEYNIQMNKYNALNAEYDQLYPQPMKHASTHASGGTDPITPSDIGAYSKNETDTLLKNKAPAGYGLGNDSSKGLTSSDNLDEISGSGWYFWYNDVPVGAPDDYCTMRVDTGYNGSLVWCHQHIWKAGRNEERVRGFLDDGSEWSEWEWVNPPMALGVEYRTTERYLGKPVYVMAFDFGNLPNASEKTVSMPNSDSKSKIFEISALVNNDYTITGRTGTGDESEHWITAFSNSAYIVTKGDVSSRTAIVYAKYYKTTD